MTQRAAPTLVHIVLAPRSPAACSRRSPRPPRCACPRAWIPRLVSFAVGALLGAVFLELLPHALETGARARR